MNTPTLNDSRTAGIMNRVRDEVSNLREDIGSLLSHQTRDTLPHNARELADAAKHRIAAGGTYAASRLRDLRQNRTAEWIGGAVIVGLLAAGAYALTHNGHSSGKGAAELEKRGAEDDINC